MEAKFFLVPAYTITITETFVMEGKDKIVIIWSQTVLWLIKDIFLCDLSQICHL